jgi:hypothetical protein
MKRGRKPTIKNLPQAVAEACKAITARGKRPSVVSVRTFLVKKQGSAPSFRELAPVLRDWKNERHDSKAVVCRAYGSLDAEQQRPLGIGSD